MGMDGYPTLAVLNRLFDAIVDDDNVSTLPLLTHSRKTLALRRHGKMWCPGSDVRVVVLWCGVGG